jgi:cyclopropane-fatty-acyl-phospholipid synthase
MNLARSAVLKMLDRAGIELGGSAPWDIVVHDERFYARVFSDGSLGLGESYSEGWWDAERIDLFIERLFRADIRTSPYTLPQLLLAARTRLVNLQSRFGSQAVIRNHYDLGNDLYQAFLDPYLQYSCGYFKGTADLATAQRQKLKLICDKLHLQPGERLLDIGCGWGGLAQYAAQEHQADVVGVTLSEKQAMLARERVRGLPVEIRVQDYRDVHDGPFDKAVSVGMFEHVGYKNYRTYFERVFSLLPDDGVFLLHTIGQNETWKTGDPWVEKYIFPGGMLPSPSQIADAVEGLFVIEDWHNFGPYYHTTLRAWDDRFQEAFPKLKEQYPDPFFRTFRYYLNSFAGAFKARRIHLWQIVLKKRPADAVFETVR